MILNKPLNILCYEDDEVNQKLLKRVAQTLDAKISIRDNYMRAKTILSTHLVQDYDVIIADYMMPYQDAGSVLNELAETKKTVVFFTCLSQEDFIDNCKKIIGRVPDNFKFVRKATPGMLSKLKDFIRSCA
tara:strand:+ start:2155 stop:2547 length:393 start_codon:yes stop_codon:yes gene_type:complete